MNEILAVPPIQNIGDDMPTGVILPFAGNGAIPDGWSECDGSELSRTTYKDLFDVIGTTYGAGDGSTTFNKPDFRGKTIWGDTTPGIVKQAGLPNINGRIGVAYYTGNTKEGAFYYSDTTGSQGYAGNNTKNKDYIFDASKSNAIYGNSETVQPPAITVRMIIKL